MASLIDIPIRLDRPAAPSPTTARTRAIPTSGGGQASIIFNDYDHPPQLFPDRATTPEMALKMGWKWDGTRWIAPPPPTGGTAPGRIGILATMQGNGTALSAWIEPPEPRPALPPETRPAPVERINFKGTLEARAYEILTELAGGRLPEFKVPASWGRVTKDMAAFIYLRRYMDLKGIDHAELVRILNTVETPYDRATQRFSVPAGVQYGG